MPLKLTPVTSSPLMAFPQPVEDAEVFADVAKAVRQNEYIIGQWSIEDELGRRPMTRYNEHGDYIKPTFNSFEFSSDLFEQMITIDATNEAEARWLLKRAELEKRNREIIQNAGASQLLAAHALGTISDPAEWAFLAVTAPVKGAQWLTRLGKWGLAGAATGTARETALHNLHDFRTLEESLYNVGAEAFLSGAMGVAFGKRLPPDLAPVVEKLDTDFKALQNGQQVTSYSRPEVLESINARHAAGEIDESEKYALMLKEEQDMLELKGRRFYRWFRRMTPVADLAMTRLPYLAKVTEQLIGVPFLRKMDDFLPSSVPVEARIQSDLAQVQIKRLKIWSDLKKAMREHKISDTELNELFERAYRYDDPSKFDAINTAVKRLDEARKPLQETYAKEGLIPAANADEIRAMTRRIELLDKKIKKSEKDINAAKGKKRNDKEISEKNIEIQKLKGEKKALSKELGSLRKRKPKDLEVQKTISARIRDVEAKRADVQKRLNRLTTARNKLKAKDRSAQRRLDRLVKAREQMIEERKTSIIPEREGYSIPFGDTRYMPTIWNSVGMFENKQLWIKTAIDDLQDQAGNTLDEKVLRKSLEETWQTIVQRNNAHFDKSIVVPGSQRTKARKLKLRSKNFRDVDAGDGRKVSFVRTGINEMFDAHDKEMITLLHLKRAGLDDPDKILKEIDEGYRLLIEAEPNIKARRAIEKEHRRLKAKFEGVYNVLQGKFGKINNSLNSVYNDVGAGLRSFNVMRLMGGVLIPSMTDVGAIIGRRGLGRTLSLMGKLASNPALRSLSRKELDRLSVVAEILTGDRAHIIKQHDDLIPQRNWARKLDKGADITFKISGMNHWNDMAKKLQVLLYMDEILGYATGTLRLSKTRRAKLNKSGISDEILDELKTNFNKHGETVDGVRIPNLDKWVNDLGDELPVVDFMRAILKREADTGVVTPGAGDLPLWSRSTAGKVVGQFKSFSFAAFNRIFIPQTQLIAAGDGSALAGMITMLAMGGLVFELKHYMHKGEWVDPSDNYTRFLREAYDRSGFTGILADILAMSEKATGNFLGFNPLGGHEITRYYSRNWHGDVFGPTEGLASDLYSTASAVSRLIQGGDVSESEIRSTRRLAPFQSHPLFRITQDDQAVAENIRNMINDY